MCALVPVLSSSWFPQDDLLLKNAVEAGASLESLAKGAVEFSRRFTLEELRDRWYALLYDPIISLDASFQMSKSEKSSPTGGLKASSGCQNSGTAKRKSESVRNSYYAMRKRICHDPFSTLDSGGYLVSPINSNDCIVNSDELFGPDYVGLNDQSFLEPGLLSSPPADDVFVHQDAIEAQNPQSVNNSYFDGIHYSANVEFSQPKEIPNLDPFETYYPNDIDDHAGGSIFGEDGFMNSDISDSLLYCSTLPEEQFFTSVPEMINQDAFGFPDYANSSGYGGTTVHLDTRQESPIPSSPLNNELLEEISHELMDPLGEEELLSLIDIDQKDTMEKDYIDSLSSIIFDSSNYNLPNTETIEAATGIHHSLASGEAEDDKVMPSILGCESSLISSQIRPTDDQSPSDELREEAELCVLNTEDTEVPCNDDVFLLYQMTLPAFPYSSLEMEHRHESRNPAPSFVNDFHAREESLVGSGKLERIIPQMLNTPFKSSEENNDVRIQIPYAEKPVEAEVVDNRVINNIHDDRAINNNHDDIFTATNHQANQTQHPELGSMMNDMEMNEEEIHLDSDDEIPNFSDIEALILDMNLIPDDKDSHPVFGYHDDASKRSVIRLEQAATSYIHRAIAYKNALAVLCGRHTKYFIKKPEVLLGRTTNDHCRVDIDLSRERRASKISRRQAIIKMDKNGSFSMKNIGNGLIFVNGNMIAPKQTANLPSNCLIDVRGMCFIFETIEGPAKKLLEERYDN